MLAIVTWSVRVLLVWALQRNRTTGTCVCVCVCVCVKICLRDLFTRLWKSASPKICRMSQKQETQEEPLFHFESKGRKKKKKLMPSSEAGRQEDYPLTQVEGQPFVLFWPLTDWVRPTI